MDKDGKLVTKKIAKVSTTQVKGFMDFIRSQGVMGLAVGLVLGTAVTATVTSFINNVFMPPLGLLLGSADGLKGLTWVISDSFNGKSTTIAYGAFLNDLINFLVIAFVVYLIVKLFDVDIKKK